MARKCGVGGRGSIADAHELGREEKGSGNEGPGEDPARCTDDRWNRAGSCGMRRWRHVLGAIFPASLGDAVHAHSENNRGESGELVHSRPSECAIYSDGNLQRRKHSEPDNFRQLELFGNAGCGRYEGRTGSGRRGGKHHHYGDFGSGEWLGDAGSGWKHDDNGNFGRSAGLDVLNRNATRARPSLKWKARGTYFSVVTGTSIPLRMKYSPSRQRTLLRAKLMSQITKAMASQTGISGIFFQRPFSFNP